MAGCRYSEPMRQPTDMLLWLLWRSHPREGGSRSASTARDATQAAVARSRRHLLSSGQRLPRVPGRGCQGPEHWAFEAEICDMVPLCASQVAARASPRSVSHRYEGINSSCCLQLLLGKASGRVAPACSEQQLSNSATDMAWFGGGGWPRIWIRHRCQLQVVLRLLRHAWHEREPEAGSKGERKGDIHSAFRDVGESGFTHVSAVEVAAARCLHRSTPSSKQSLSRLGIVPKTAGSVCDMTHVPEPASSS